ncbi:MAG: hypothetical protein SFX73_22985 [Kofleriaceae bacterium]|nr:hypothetical protein [Kofleriaceae bacterium]
MAAEIEEVGEVVEGSRVTYDLPDDPSKAGPGARARLAGEVLDKYFASSYASTAAPPDELIHVTCGGSVTPSGAERLVAERQWPTRVTHLYRQGGHAAVTAIHTAAARLRDVERIDIAHTELGSFGTTGARDGLIRYSMIRDQPVRGLGLLATHQCALGDVVDAFTQPPPPSGVPESIAAALRTFVRELFRLAGTDLGRLRDAMLAVHPSDPWVLDRVIDVLLLRDEQLAASSFVVRERGELQSATLPHIWMRILDDTTIDPGTLVPSLAFGPGPTLWGALLEKRAAQ